MLTETSHKQTEKEVPKGEPTGTTAFDSISLLKTDRPSGKTSDVTPTQLTFTNDIYKTSSPSKATAGSVVVADSEGKVVPAGSDGPKNTDKTRFLKPEPGVRAWLIKEWSFDYNVPKPDKTPPELATLITPEGKEPTKSAKRTFDITGNLSAIDNKKPTVAFLEAPEKDPSLTFDGMSLTHAQVSALPAAEHGFNSIILNSKISDQHIGEPDPMPRLLADAAESIRTGALPLVKGDVLNISLGNNVAKDDFHQAIAGTGDPTYKELNAKTKPLGLTITPENLEANRDKLLKALETIAKNPHDKKWQAIAQTAIDSNAALKKIDAMGIEVLHASGNDGTDHVDLNFLSARHQLASADPKTHIVDSFSNANSLTETGDGVIPVRREKPGRYLFGDVSVPASDFCAINASDCHTTVSQGDIGMNQFGIASDQGHADAYFKIKVGRSVAPPVDTDQGHLVGFSIGTSFINDDWLEKNLDRLTDKKAHAFQMSHE